MTSPGAGPYIIEIRRHIQGVDPKDFQTVVESRRAVTTLEEAHEKYHEQLYVLGIEPDNARAQEWRLCADAWYDVISETGGSFALPGGTVFEVKKEKT